MHGFSFKTICTVFPSFNITYKEADAVKNVCKNRRQLPGSRVRFTSSLCKITPIFAVTVLAACTKVKPRLISDIFLFIIRMRRRFVNNPWSQMTYCQQLILSGSRHVSVDSTSKCIYNNRDRLSVFSAQCPTRQEGTFAAKRLACKQQGHRTQAQQEGESTCGF